MERDISLCNDSNPIFDKDAKNYTLKKDSVFNT